MIGQRLRDPVWRRRNRSCVFLSVLPVFGWFGFLFMGRKSGRRQYTNTGIIYCALSMVTYALLAAQPLIERLGWRYRPQNFLYQALEEFLYFYGYLLLIILWVVCCIHTLAKSKQYLQYLSLKEASKPIRNSLTQDRNWRLANSGWMLWNCLPYMGGFSLIFAGERTGNKKVKSFGLVSLTAVFGLRIAANAAYQLDSSYWGRGLLSLAHGVTGAFWILDLLTAYLVREEYLDAWAVVWTGDTHRQPNLADRKWRAGNSGWQVWTYFPVVGGIGIALAGVRGRIKKHTVAGLLFCAASGALFILTTYLDGIRFNYVFSENRSLFYSIYDSLPWISGLLYLVILFYGTRIRWETLLGRADALQGYSSEFERDLDLYNRTYSRERNLSAKPVKSEPRLKEKPAPRDGELVDINRGTQEELMLLPGIGVIQAKQAMDYRAANQGFRSLDEFVEVLRIKPHFAVQIFAKATVGKDPEPGKQTASGDGPVRRRIDF